MTLTPGARLGPYEIVAHAGAGGMGDVYRARDVRLDREVAIKTIKGPFTERFEREARAISALNHPNICTLYDVGEHEGHGYLVMEYVDGKPIAGPLPPDQAIAYGIQICDALHAAHKKGIVHRDLKPANILLTRQGIKLLDFGLAKLGMPGQSAILSGAGSAVEQATMAALTGAHTIVGTPQYMAPEQIEGREADARSDIFAFGCVLYELLTGHRAFEGKSSSSIMAAILATTPQPIEELVPLTPPALERVVTRCLEKDPEDRWQTARDIASELKWITQGGSRVGLPAAVAIRRRTRERVAWLACGLATLAAIAFAIAWARRAPAPPAVVRFALQTPDGLSSPSTPEVSPDGRNIVFAASGSDGKRFVWLRALDALEQRPLSGSDGAQRPFWSPDSRFVAFIADGKLKKVDIAGGPAQIICDAPTGSDGSWSSEGVILFDGRGSDPIWRVPASGGVAKTEVGAEKHDGVLGAAGWPMFLPDGRHFLYMTLGGDGSEQTLRVRALDSTESKPLFKTTSRVVYAEPGYLLYVRDQTLVAQRFSPRSLTVEGEPIPLGEGLGVDAVGLASFSVSRNGVLAFRAGEQQGRRLLWVDRAGKQSPASDADGDYNDFAVSPDGKRLAFDLTGSQGRGDLWIRDLTRGVTSRFTFDPADETSPLWSPDGRNILYTSRVKGPGDLYLKDAAGTKEPEVLLATPEVKYASDWSPDGKYILYTTQTTDTGWDIWALPLTGERTPVALVKTKFDELFATFSPDGRYIAYRSAESGRMQVYVQEFPDARNKWQVSTDGGTEPFWRADGRELFYRSAERVMVVPVQTGETFTVGTPAPLFETRFAQVTVRSHYRPEPDGQRFMVLSPLGRDAIQPAAVVLNWTAAIKP